MSVLDLARRVCSFVGSQSSGGGYVALHRLATNRAASRDDVRYQNSDDPLSVGGSVA